MKFLVVVLVVLGALLIAGGTGLAYLPAGLIVGGLESIGAAYVIGYLKARTR